MYASNRRCIIVHVKIEEYPISNESASKTTANKDQKNMASRESNQLICEPFAFDSLTCQMYGENRLHMRVDHYFTIIALHRIRIYSKFINTNCSFVSIYFKAFECILYSLTVYTRLSRAQLFRYLSIYICIHVYYIYTIRSTYDIVYDEFTHKILYHMHV